VILSNLRWFFSKKGEKIMPLTKIVVTQQDIDEAPRKGWKFGHPYYGPVNSALCRTLGLPSVEIDGIYPNELSWVDGDVVKHMKFSGKVLEIVWKFDNGEAVAPFEFELDFPS